MLQSDLCDYSDEYIVVKETTVADPNDDAYDQKLAAKTNAPFISCISKISNTLIGNAKDLEIQRLEVQNLLIIKQKLQEDQRVKIRKKKLKLLCH